MSYIINPYFSSVVTGALDGLSFSGAWSPGRLLISTFGSAIQTNSGGFYDSWTDQTGNGRDMSNTTTARPAVSTAGPNSVVCGDFDGSNDWLNSNQGVSTFMSNSAGYAIISCLPDTIAASDTTNPYNNNPLWGDSGGFLGLYLRTGTPNIVESYNFDGNNDKIGDSTISTGTPYVIEWWHDSGNLFICVNNGTPTSVASGNTSNVVGTIGIGHGYTGASIFLDGKIFEFAIASTVPATRSTIAANFKTYIGA